MLYQVIQLVTFLSPRRLEVTILSRHWFRVTWTHHAKKVGIAELPDQQLPPNFRCWNPSLHGHLKAQNAEHKWTNLSLTTRRFWHWKSNRPVIEESFKTFTWQTMICQEKLLSCHFHQEVFRLSFFVLQTALLVTANSMGTITASECQILPVRTMSSFENAAPLGAHSQSSLAGSPRSNPCWNCDIFSTSSPCYVWAQECGRSELANAETELCCL